MKQSHLNSLQNREAPSRINARSITTKNQVIFYGFIYHPIILSVLIICI